MQNRIKKLTMDASRAAPDPAFPCI